jgi:hypothetical protein
MPPRRNVGALSVKRRWLGKCSLMRVQEQQYSSLVALFLLFASMARRGNHAEERVRALIAFALLFIEQLRGIQTEITFIRDPIERRYLRFVSLRPETAKSHFRFTIPHLRVLLRCFGFPGEVQLDNGSWVNSQEGLMVMLKFVAFPLRLIGDRQVGDLRNLPLPTLFVPVLTFLFTS